MEISTVNPAPLRAHSMAAGAAGKKGRPARTIGRTGGTKTTQKLDFKAVLGSVSESDTEQIVRLPLDLLDPDPDNFYSLDGLDELAGNIELMGLLDPIRVRPDGERYTIVSGHRRRAAILLIRDGGSEQFKDGVPCIVEYGEASDAMRRLRLIYANANTRQLSSAEMSRQAEEVTRLLYELQAQGVEFPGRMRDHVAQACGVTKSKIARLHAIRQNLAAPLFAFYDGGEMVEDVAYQLSRFPVDIQIALGEALGPADGKHLKMPVGSTVEAVFRNLEDLRKPFPCRAHAGGPDCHHLTERVVRSLLQQYSWSICDAGKCCMDCYRSKEGCPGRCREARDRANVEKAAEKEKEEARKRDEELSQRILKNRIRDRAKALLPYAEMAGLGEKDRISGDWRSATVGQLRQWAAGEFGEAHFYGDECVRPGQSKDAAGMAQRLGCSLELALGIPEREERIATPACAPARNDRPSWTDGTPEKKGWYAVRLLFLGKPLFAPRVFWWNGEQWVQKDADEKERAMDRACEVVCWIALPEEKE